MKMFRARGLIAALLLTTCLSGAAKADGVSLPPFLTLGSTTCFLGLACTSVTGLTLVTPTLGVAAGTSLSLSGSTAGTKVAIETAAAANIGVYVHDAASQSAPAFRYSRVDDILMLEIKRSASGTAGMISLYNSGGSEVKLSSNGGLIIDAGATATFRMIPSDNDIYFQNTVTSGDIYFTGLNSASLTGKINFRNTGIINFGAAGSERLIIAVNGAATFGGQVVMKSYAIASLPTGITYGRAFVTDQITACPLTGVAPTNGGAIVCPVYYNGSAWVGG